MWYERGMLFWVIWYQSHLARPKIHFMRVILVKFHVSPTFSLGDYRVGCSKHALIRWFRFMIFTLVSFISRYCQMISAKKTKIILKKTKKKISPPTAAHPLRNPVFLAKIAVNLKFWPFLALPQFIISNVIWKENAFLNNLVPISFC